MATARKTPQHHNAPADVDQAAEVEADASALLAEVEADPTPDGTVAMNPPGTTDTPQVDASAEILNSATGQEAASAPKEKRKYERKVIKEVPLDELGEAEDVPEDEWEQTPLITGAAVERSAAQKQIDVQFAELLKKWKEAGEPEPRKSPRSRRVISPEHAPAIRFMVSASAKLYDVAVKFAPAAFDKDGREVIVYSPATKIRRPRKSSTPTEVAAAEKQQTEDNLEAAESVLSASDGSLPGE